MSAINIHLTPNYGGPLHYLGNRFLTLPDLTGHMHTDTDWLNEHFSVLFENNKGKKYKTAVEPFAGSASWSIAAMELGLADEYIINDSNEILINTLQLIKEQPDLIKNSYENLADEYEHSPSKKEFFLSLLEGYNRSLAKQKALLLPFIINHSWGGIIFYDQNLNIIYREAELFEGKKSDRFLEKANITPDMFINEVDRVSNILNRNKVQFTSGDFKDVLSLVEPGDFVALNPPYPENEHVTLEQPGIYIELYSPQKLHNHLVEIIEQFENKGIHYYMTYGFYNPKFNDYVIRNTHNEPLNYFRVLGYKDCAFGVGLDQLYFSSQLSIPKHINICKAEQVLGNKNITPEEALERYTKLWVN
ncbi:TPA: DNA adenine methylase [Legionella pneumophila]